MAAGRADPGENTSPLEPGWQIMWLVTRWLYRMSLVVEMKPQLWQTPEGTGHWAERAGREGQCPSPGCAGGDRAVPTGHSPFRVSVCTFRCRSQLALVVKADRQIRQTNGRSPAGQMDTQC